MRRYLTFIFLTLFLVACQAMNGSTSQPTAIDEKAVWTSVAATLYVGLTETATGATRMPARTPTSTANPTNTPLPVRIPTTEPTKVSSVLQPALIIQPSDSFGGHTAQKITGWKYGFESFEWIDANHLLLNAFVDETGLSYGIIYPAVLNLSTKKIWLPELTPETLTSNGLLFHYKPYWSDKLHRLISNNILSSGEMVIELYDLDGNLVKSYPRRLTSISPSGTKIMVDSGIWLDLVTDKIVSFAWDFTWHASLSDDRPKSASWSADEMNVFVCCYFYGNARTDESFQFKPSNYDFDFAHGTWMLNDTYFLPDCCGIYQGSGFVGVFVVPDKTFLNVNELAGIPRLDGEGSINCSSWSASPDKKHVWISCQNGNYLIDLKTFKSQVYPDSVNLTNYWSSDQWSSDGNFALDDSSQSILSVDKNDLKPISSNYYNNLCKWHPTDNRLLCIASDNRDILSRAKDCDKPTPEANCSSSNAQTILIWEAQTGSVSQKLTFPTQVQEMIWSPDGKRLALLAEDNSLWTIEYPGLDKLEQLTPALPNPVATPLGMKPGLDNVAWSSKGISPAISNRLEHGIKNVAWSPDGTSLAFIEGQDIYIVDTQVKP